MAWDIYPIILRYDQQCGDDFCMSGLIRGLPIGAAIKQGLQFAQVVHAEAMEITPARGSEKIVDGHCCITLAGQALIAAQFLSGLFGFVSIVVGIE
ncbi:hypothetical protein AVT06_14365 [Pseudomonas aeruginosa]|nr:hypothetical protein AAY82_19835 [Pseudomonas aeruginosa]KZE30783.1 hypothetical protein AVT06_14365 [Pseudomonas aeruginosa]